MKKTSLRLIVTEACGRDCADCCNKSLNMLDYPVMTLDELEESDYKEVLLTGGEPLLFPKKVKEILKKVGRRESVCLYTAVACDLDDLSEILNEVTGFTYTIHDAKGVEDFLKIKDLCEKWTGSRRLNIFREAIHLVPAMILHEWKVMLVDWIKDCPVPKNEDLRRLVHSKI